MNSTRSESGTNPLNFNPFDVRTALRALHGDLPVAVLAPDEINRRLVARPGTASAAASDTNPMYVVWAGSWWDKNEHRPKCGYYFQPGLHDPSMLRSIDHDLHARVRDWGKALGNATVAMAPALFGEGDRLPIAEQKEEVRRFCEFAGLPGVTLGVLSGSVEPEHVKAANLPDGIVPLPGRSYQPYLRLAHPAEVGTDEAAEARWLYAQRLWCLIIEGDPAVARSVAHRMRLPGVVARRLERPMSEGVRLQAVADFNPDVTVDLEWFIATAERYLRDVKGCADINAGWRSYVLADQLDHHDGDTAKALANRIRSHRIATDEDETDAGVVMGKRVGSRKGHRDLARAGAGSAACAAPAQSIDLDTPITLADGREGSIKALVAALNLKPDGDTVSCFCPMHANTQTPAATLGVSHGGTPRIHCFGSCGANFYAEEPDDLTLPTAADAGDVDVDVDAVFDGTMRWETPEIVPKPGTVYLFVGPIGSSKTKAAARLAATVKSYVAVAPTQRLTGDLSTRFPHAVNYSEITGPIREPRVTCCLPSLLNVPLAVGDAATGGRKFLARGYWHLDEIEELLAEMHCPQIMTRHVDGGASTEDGRRTSRENISGTVYDHLASHLHATLDAGGIVTMADAYPSKRLLDEVKRLTGRDDKDIVIVAPPPGYQDLAGTKEHTHRSLGSLVATLIEHVTGGGSATVACDTKEKVKALQAVIRAIILPDGSTPTVLVHHGDEKSALTEGVTDLWDRHQVVIFNQACGSGVSYEGKRHTHHFLVADAWTGESWTTLPQLRGRNRTATVRHSWVAPRGSPPSTPREAVREHEIQRAMATGRMTYKGMDGGLPVLAPRDGEHFESMCDQHWIDGVRATHVRDRYYNDIEKRGCRFVNVPDRPDAGDVERQLKATAEAVKKGDVTRARASAVLTAQAARGLLRKPEKTAADQSALAHYTTFERWGTDRDDLLADTISTRATKWAQAQNYAGLTAVVMQEPDGLRDAERIRMAVALGKKGRYRGQAAHHELRHRLAREVLALAGMAVKDIVKPLHEEATRDTVPTATTVGFATWTMGSEGADLGLEQYTNNRGRHPQAWSTAMISPDFVGRIQALDATWGGLVSWMLGRVPTDAEKAPAYVGMLLYRYGVRLQRTGKGGSGGRVIDATALKAWASLCIRAYCRVTGRQVEAVDDLARAAGLEVRGSDGAEHRREAASEDRTSAEKAQAAALDAIVNLLFDDDGPRSSASTAGAPVQSPG